MVPFSMYDFKLSEMEKVRTWFRCARNNRLLSLSSHRPFVDLLKDTYLVYLGKVRLVMRTKPDSLFVALSSQEPDTIDDKAIHADTAE